MKISNFKLSILCLLLIIGLLSVPLFVGSSLIYISYTMCLIGGLAFGMLANRMRAKR